MARCPEVVVQLDKRFAGFAESLGVAVVVSDVDGVVAFANGVADELFAGLLAGSDLPFVGSRITDHRWQLLHEDGSELGLESSPAGRARASGDPVRDEVVGVIADGAPPRWLVQSAVPVARDETSGRHVVVSTFVDITSRKELEARLEQRASHDPLTGLSNLECFVQRLEEAAQRAARDVRPLALLYVDLDHFKGCNDMLGHAAGDRTLVAVADRLRSLVRPTDTVARVGGDEFALVLEGADADRAMELADQLIVGLARSVEIAGGREFGGLKVGASVGIAVLDPGGDLEALRLAADDALFAAKRAGRGRAVLHRADAPHRVVPTLPVDAEDAHAWSAYLGDLRAEIGRRKEEGTIPEMTGAPDTLFRVLVELLARIELLPPDGPAVLELPHENDLGPYLFHHANVERWVDGLRAEGILTIIRPEGAGRFWDALSQVVPVVATDADERSPSNARTT